MCKPKRYQCRVEKELQVLFHFVIWATESTITETQMLCPGKVARQFPRELASNLIWKGKLMYSYYKVTFVICDSSLFSPLLLFPVDLLKFIFVGVFASEFA